MNQLYSKLFAVDSENPDFKYLVSDPAKLTVATVLLYAIKNNTYLTCFWYCKYGRLM